MLPYIIVAGDDPARVGNKAANLARLASIEGIAIPPYFAVSAWAFDLAVANSAPLIRTLEAETADSLRIPDLAAAIRGRIFAAPVSPELAASITDAYRVLSHCFGEDASQVAVRSSGTGEDGSTASHAGQYATRLGVTGAAAVIRAVREVWASTYATQAVRYRKQQPDSRSTARMGVIVQRMVDAAAAGTIYTIDPETGAPMTCINAVEGLGVADVAGERTPTSWVVDPQSLTVVRRRGAPGIADPIGSDTLRELARQAGCIAVHFLDRWGTAALDLEYAVDAGGRIAWTQSRPETVWARGRAELTAVDLDQAASLTGLYAGGMTGSPGVAAGILRVVPSLAEAEAVAEVGDVLLTPNTSNVWEQLFCRIGAIITEVGGTGSHTAVVMRELRKPALVGAGGAMQALAAHDGRPITLDATQRMVFAGREAAGLTHRLATAVPSYGGLDIQSEDEAWAEAATQPGRTLTDAAGRRWICKPEYPVCSFMQSIYLEAHRWIGQRLGVPAHNRIHERVHRVPFGDAMQWRLRLREWALEDLERLQQERERVAADYLASSACFDLNPTAVGRWLKLYVRLNAFVGLGFAIYKVTEGLLDQALAEHHIVEPYYTQIRCSRASQGELESSRAADSLGRLTAGARGDRELQEALASACAGQSDEPIPVGAYRPFYERIEQHARAFKVTPVAEIDLPLRSAVLAVGQAILGILGSGLQEASEPSCFTSDKDLTFFPHDSRLRRVLHLALAAEKARQDAHHLRVRGHWWVRGKLDQLAALVVEEGRISSPRALFDHPPEWLVAQLYERSPSACPELRRVCHVQ